MSQLRPISLCNVLFKIASKSLGNQLKSILTHIISPTQSVFVLGWNISDNIILASELSNYLFKHQRGNNGLLSFKLDINKTYDCIGWEYVSLPNLGFSNWQIDLMMTCVSSVSYSFIINGCPRGYLHLSQGLR